MKIWLKFAPGATKSPNFFAITSGKVYLWLWKTLENSGIFFSYFVVTLKKVTPVTIRIKEATDRLRYTWQLAINMCLSVCALDVIVLLCTWRQCLMDLSFVLCSYQNAVCCSCINCRQCRRGFVADECVMLSSWFMVHDTSVKTLQAGVFRTNCVDSLDRTNVVQSMLAERVLHEQFVVSLDVFSRLMPMTHAPETGARKLASVSFSRQLQNFWRQKPTRTNKK